MNKRIIEVSKRQTLKMTKTQIYAYVAKHKFERVSRGIYAPSDTIVDELMILQSRCPKGVISHDEALYYYGLIDREPFLHSITVYSGYNTYRLNSAGYKTYYVKKELLELGKTSIINNFGNKINIYDIDRTIIDMIRNRSKFEIQDFNTALKKYVLSDKKNLNNLYIYAKAFKLEKILKMYMEVLL